MSTCKYVHIFTCVYVYVYVYVHVHAYGPQRQTDLRNFATPVSQ